jgi:hypothetical protein
MSLETVVGTAQIAVFVFVMVACCLAGLTDRGDR